MARSIGEVPAAIENAGAPNKVSSFPIKLVTPLIGGGVEAGENDPVALIRVSSIRGQLRFWWRATVGAKYDSASELRDRESQVWGSVTEPSRISLWITDVAAGQRREVAKFVKDSNGQLKNNTVFEPGLPAYALFPFQGSAKGGREEKRPAVATFGVEFTLNISFPESLSNDVQASLWAWTNFGGLGSRTRRGCGALFCKDFAPASVSAEGIRPWFAAMCDKYELSLPPAGARPWPTLYRALYVGKECGPFAQKAWCSAVDAMKDFRQGPGTGRNLGDGGKHPGRSRWPEADSLRALTGKAHRTHAKPITISNPKTSPAFPRAELGLPIVMQFKDSSSDPPKCDILPADIPVKDSSRMASPFVLRPLVALDGKAAPMILCLMVEPLPGVWIKTDDGPLCKKKSFGQGVVRRHDLTQYGKSPIGQNRSKVGSAVEGFLSFIAEPKQDYKKVLPQ